MKLSNGQIEKLKELDDRDNGGINKLYNKFIRYNAQFSNEDKFNHTEYEELNALGLIDYKKFSGKSNYTATIRDDGKEYLKNQLNE